jgi:hypothetical protein
VSEPNDAPGQLATSSQEPSCWIAAADLQGSGADDHRWSNNVIDVGRNNRSATGDFFVITPGDFFSVRWC